MTTNWKAFAEELLRAVEDARREIADLDVVCLELDDKTVKVVGPATPGALVFVETYDVEQVMEDLADSWRRKLYVAQIVDDREQVAP